MTRTNELNEHHLIKERHLRVGEYVEVHHGKGKHIGKIFAIATDTDAHPHPPKVLFKDQHGVERANNPSACHVLKGAALETALAEHK